MTLPWLPPDQSAHGPALDRMLLSVHGLMAVLFVGWAIFFITALIRFRRGAHPKADYAGVRNHRFSTFHEIGVALFEIVLLVGFAIPLWARTKSSPPPEEGTVQVHVVAEQFSWNIHYPGPDGKFGRRDISLVDAGNPLGLDRSDPAAKDDITTVNDLHLPVGRTAFIRLSTKDVIHSLNLPYMRVKQDAIPGMSVPVWFEPTVADTSEIACAQLCGLGHYRMRGRLIVHPPGGFEAWVEEREAELNPGSGEAPPDSGTVAPTGSPESEAPVTH